MDDKQLTTLIERVLSRIKEKSMGYVALPKAYLILPQNWQQNQSQCTELLHTLRGAYHTTAVLPDADSNIDVLYGAGVCATVPRSEAVFPTEEFLTVFPIASRNLVVKTVLCLQDDFETRWIARCIALGQPIYMRKESPLFTGREPDVYKKKIECYYRDAEAFGIQFDRLSPPKCGNMPLSKLFGTSEKKRIITVEDLKELQTSKELWLCPGDVVTPLAAERAEEFGISIFYK